MSREGRILCGQIQAVIYHNERSGYSVLRIRSDEGETPVAAGCLPFPAPGETVELSGKWIVHPSYGEQFSIHQAERLLPDEPETIEEYLASGVIPGIGPATAARMVSLFGDQTLSVLESAPERFSSVRGLTAARAAEMGEVFRRQSDIRRLMEFFSQHHLPEYMALRLYRMFGADGREALEQNPYLLLQDPFRLAFQKVDDFAAALGVTDDAPCRLEAAVFYELAFNAEQGHVYLPRRSLLDASSTMLGGMEDGVEAALGRLLADAAVVADDQDGRDACYLASLHRSENYVAGRISRMVCLPPEDGEDDRCLDDCLARVFQDLALQQDSRPDISPGETPERRPPQLAGLQREAVALSARERLSLLTGGPGTGKTTAVRAMVALAKERNEKVLLAAPTGRAARRLAELTGTEAFTVHRLLETAFDSESGLPVFRKNEKDLLRAGLVILDETSMIDIALMESLLRALPEETRLVLVGDPDQLPAVGPGNVLADLLRCEVVPRVRLTEIFRQAAESQIVLSAHAVNRGEMPPLNLRGGDFFFLPRNSPAAVHETLGELCLTRLPNRMGFKPWQIQVLTPTRRGPAGTGSLNKLLQSALNPPDPSKAERRFGDITFRAGDRVMQTRNDYELVWESPDGTSGRGVFNGDIGWVEAIDPADESMTVAYDNGLVRYPFDLLNELELAYAMTVHKSQGSEYDVVVLSVSPCASRLLTRRVLYTAITRAKKLLVMVGNRDIVEKMTKNSRGYGRYSALAVRISQLTGCAG